MSDYEVERDEAANANHKQSYEDDYKAVMKGICSPKYNEAKAGRAGFIEGADWGREWANNDPDISAHGDGCQCSVCKTLKNAGTLLGKKQLALKVAARGAVHIQEVLNQEKARSQALVDALEGIGSSDLFNEEMIVANQKGLLGKYRQEKAREALKLYKEK